MTDTDSVQAISTVEHSFWFLFYQTESLTKLLLCRKKQQQPTIRHWRDVLGSLWPGLKQLNMKAFVGSRMKVVLDT